MGILDRFRKRPPRESADAPPPVAPPADGLQTPLSDLMTRVLNDPAPAHRQAFHAAFLKARVGVIASGLPAAANVLSTTPATRLDGGRIAPAGQVGFARAATPDGRTMVLACADRGVFVQRFHARFNVEVLGRELAAMALAVPDCEGILVNSASSFHSLAIDRAQIAALLADA